MAVGAAGPKLGRVWVRSALSHPCVAGPPSRGSQRVLMALAQGPLMFMMKWCVGEERCFAVCVCVCVCERAICAHRVGVLGVHLLLRLSKTHGGPGAWRLSCLCVFPSLCCHLFTVLSHVPSDGLSSKDFT